ncbi:MAG: type II secretion system GspH family protein [Tenericutes bacterium]|nr:type II secretion system GspH family protein [Mycoplasmatota bacterium]
MKEKGFTLIELLAVIVILSVITLITVPMITNVIEESKKKALVSSVEAVLDSTDYFTMSHDVGVYEFLFDEEHQGTTIKGESLDYRGTIDGEGKLYLDKEGNVSVCISNDTYYVYKNYNSGIIVGDKKTGNCIIGFDALTNKYVAMLDNGTGNVSNVYSKDEVNNLIDAKATELDNKITNNTNEITNMKSNIEELQSNLNNLSSLVNNNTLDIHNINNRLDEIKGISKVYTGTATVTVVNGKATLTHNLNISDHYSIQAICTSNQNIVFAYTPAANTVGLAFYDTSLGIINGSRNISYTIFVNK